MQEVENRLLKSNDSPQKGTPQYFNLLNVDKTVEAWYEEIVDVLMTTVYAYNLPDSIDTLNTRGIGMFFFEPVNIRGTLAEKTLIVYLRGDAKQEVLDSLSMLIDTFHLKLNSTKIGQDYVVLCQANEPLPFFVGSDERGRALFRATFRILYDIDKDTVNKK